MRTDTGFSTPFNARYGATIVAFLLLGVVAARQTPGAVITVGQDGASSFSVIQDAIAAAADGDEIIVNIGTYVENIHFNGKNIILRSTAPEDDDVVSSTIIDGNRSGSVVTFAGSEGTTCVLSGFTLRNGSGTNLTYYTFPFGHNLQRGGAIHSFQSAGKVALATIQYNHLTRNTLNAPHSELNWYSYAQGGAIYNCDGLIQYNRISHNIALHHDNAADMSSSFGGALHGCDGMIWRNQIFENSAQWGGAIADGSADLIGNAIFKNAAKTGGAVYALEGAIENILIFQNRASGENGRGGGLAGCSGPLQNNVICLNSVDGALEYGGGGLSLCRGLAGERLNNIIWGNTAPPNAPASSSTCSGCSKTRHSR